MFPALRVFLILALSSPVLLVYTGSGGPSIQTYAAYNSYCITNNLYVNKLMNSSYLLRNTVAKLGWQQLSYPDLVRICVAKCAKLPTCRTVQVQLVDQGTVSNCDFFTRDPCDVTTTLSPCSKDPACAASAIWECRNDRFNKTISTKLCLE